MTRIEELRRLASFDRPMDALSFDISKMALYKEQVKVSYQYIDAGGNTLNQAPVAVDNAQWEIVEDTLLLSVAAAQEAYDNALSGAVQVRVILDSTLAPTPTRDNLNPSLDAEALREELLKRDLQDTYVLEQGSAADGSIHGDNLVDGSVRLSKLATNSLPSAALQDESVTTAKIADGAVTTGKMAAGLLYAPALHDPAELSSLDITHEEDDSSVGLPYFGYISDLNVFRKASHDNLGRNGAEAAIGIARSRVGADVKIAVVDGAIVDGFSGLQAGRAYTLDNNGNPVLGSTNRVGVAVSATKLMLKGGA